MTLTSDERAELFKEELSQIPFRNYQTWVKACLDLTPDYFFEIPASSSGLHHPYWSLGEGGLVRHTKAVALLTSHLVDTMLPPNEDKDLFRSKLITAAILHDSFKYGASFDHEAISQHPYIPRTKFKKVPHIPENEADWVFKAIEAHMGSYGTGIWSALPYLTISLIKKDYAFGIVHIADFLASRKNYIDKRFIDINTEVIEKGTQKFRFISDDFLRGLVIAVLSETMSFNEVEEFVGSESYLNLFSRLSSFVGDTKRFPNIEVGLNTIREQIPLFLPRK